MFYIRNFGIWLVAALLSIALIFMATLGPIKSPAVVYKDALALIRSGDVEKIEQTFEALYQDFVDGKITAAEFNAPFTAFYTLDPIVLEMIAEWREAMPDSAQVRIAEAATKINHATILRGADAILRVPRTSYAQAQRLWSEALTLNSEALDLAPRHVWAASNLLDVAIQLRNNQAASRARRILAVYGSKEALLLTEIYDSTPQWGGSVAKMRYLCETIAPKLEGISVAVCNARATLMLLDQSREVRDQAIEVLRQEDEEKYGGIIARELLYSGKAQEALDMYDKVGSWIPGNLAAPFAHALNNYAVQERIVDQKLVFNPLHPRHLALKSEAQGRRGDFAGAAESIEKAMIYGETIPLVRRWRLAAILQDKNRHQEMLGDIEDALVDTDFHPTIMEFAIDKLVWDSRSFRYWADGTEHSHYECRRLRILSSAIDSCALHSDRSATLGCSDSSLLRVQEIIAEADFDACKDMRPLLPVQ